MSEDKIRTTSPLRCCHNNDSLTSVSTCDGAICETKNMYVKTLAETEKLSPEICLNNNMYELVSRDPDHKYIFPKRQEVDVEFQNITYTTWTWSMAKFKKEYKNILHEISGKFKAGELSVIMGPSGAGKSTLLNVLAGFTTRGSSGTVKLNETVRDQSPRYRKLSAYIPQDEELRLALTVREAMTFAAHLKLGYSVSNDYKIQQVQSVLEMLGLEQCHHTRTSRLSGGQRKRLAIALELLSNPPILYLDEPTTGLDSSSCTQCISLLKRLSQEGRTIICTIHQPSALLLEMFDKLYALSHGKCIYDGTISNLLPHLATLNLHCPPYHNPADFLMEVAIGEHGTDVNTLAAAMRVQAEIEEGHKKEKLCLEERKTLELHTKRDESSPLPAAVIMQFLLLFRRNLLTTKRSYVYLFNRLIAHIAIGFLFGYLYKDVGHGANTILANYVYLYGSLLLLVYTGKMSVTLSFPLEMKILTREHFNRWYKLSPYLLSIIMIEIPFQLLCTYSYIAISYWMTDQPHDFRLLLFALFATLATLCAQSMGYFIGSTCSIKIAVFLGPVLACLFSVFGFCLRYFDTPVIFRWMFHISYYRAAFQSVVYSIYGLGRKNLMCPEDLVYCHYQDPMKFLNEMEMTDVDLVSNISVIVLIWSLMNAATYLTLWLKLNKR